MKFAITFLLSALAAVSARTAVQVGDSMKANSKLGMHLLSKATRVDEGSRRLEDVELSAWIIDYSLKFQGCHSIVQWNAEADEEQDVRLAKKRLVRFRLCPTDTCSSTEAGGCVEGYGDYIIDMEIFLDAFYESMAQTGEEECGQYADNYCACEGNGDDSFNANQCQYDCIVAAGMTQCYQYMEDQIYAESFDVKEYMQCAQFEVRNNRRKLEQVEYFVGPFCSEQGGAIHLGMFLDDQCSIQVEDETFGAYTFNSMTGLTLPYSSKSIIGSECAACKKVDADANDDQDPEITELCQMAYQDAGKCESHVNGATAYPNEQACTYIEGIKVVRADGMVFYQKPHSNAVTTSFIVIFAMAFFAMIFYVWYLRTRLNIKPDALL
jgi:endogenous inhibitor of DNA gyrase (YacG/DUF329 family)